MTGSFLWYELLTTDKQAAIAFYSEVIGWKTELFGGSEGKDAYTLWVSNQGPLGGVTALPSQTKGLGAKPHWTSYIGVDAIDAAVDKIKATGGNVHLPPMVIPEVGRFSVIADPQGATLSLLEPYPREQARTPHDTTKHGEIAWHELYASDAKAALGFYAELFGWKLQQEVEMGAAGKYLIYGQGDKAYGGMMTITAEMAMTPCWVYYIQVDDLDGTIARAMERGAKTLFGPMAVPGGTRVAQLLDPQGILFALHGM